MKLNSLFRCVKKTRRNVRMIWCTWAGNLSTPFQKGSLFNSDLLGTECLHIHLETVGWKHSWTLNRKFRSLSWRMYTGLQAVTSFWENIFRYLNLQWALNKFPILTGFHENSRGEDSSVCIHIHANTHICMGRFRYRNIYRKRYLCVNFKKNSKGLCVYIHAYVYTSV